jgi:hypothetical protein
MPVLIQPVDLEAGAILLAAPAAAALNVENIHVGSTITACVSLGLTNRSAFFENIIVNCIYSFERRPSDFRVWHADSKSLLHAHHQLERVDGIETESIGAEKGKIIPDLVWRRLQHQIFDEHLFDSGAQVSIGHKKVRFCRKLRAGSNV